MSRVECIHEADVLEAVSLNQWPNRVEPALREHVAGCEICQELVTVVSAFEGERELVGTVPPLPESGLVWFRAQLRARQDAARVAVRPITVTQAVAFAVAVGVAGAVFGATATWFQRGLALLDRGVRSALSIQLPAPPEPLASLLATHTWVAPLSIALALLTPVALYLLVRLSERHA